MVHQKCGQNFGIRPFSTVLGIRSSFKLCGENIQFKTPSEKRFSTTTVPLASSLQKMVVPPTPIPIPTPCPPISELRKLHIRSPQDTLTVENKYRVSVARRWDNLVHGSVIDFDFIKTYKDTLRGPYNLQHQKYRSCLIYHMKFQDSLSGWKPFYNVLSYFLQILIVNIILLCQALNHSRWHYMGPENSAFWVNT